MTNCICQLLVVSILLAGGAWKNALGAESSGGVTQTSNVYYVMDVSSVSTAGDVRQTAVDRMVNTLVIAMTQKPTVAEAWRSLVKPNDVVGIKVSASGHGVSGTHPAVIEAIAKGLQAAGLPRKQIIVWDRNWGDLMAARFSDRSPYYVLKAIESVEGYDPDALLTAPVVGKLIWGDRKFGDRKGTRLVDLLKNGDQLSNQSFFAKILTRKVTKIINVPSLQDSYFCGVNGAIPSITLSNIDNWRRFVKAPHFGDPYLAEIYADEHIHSKVILTVLDGLFLQYAGGPFAEPNFTIENFSIFMSKDPVALDAVAAKLIDEQRVAAKLPSLKELAGYIYSAMELGLGEAEIKRINLVRLGANENRIRETKTRVQTTPQRLQ